MAAVTWTALLGFIVVANAFPYQHPMENPDLYQGDILLDDEDRNAVPQNNRRWPKGIVPYDIHRSLTEFYPKIREAMDQIEKDTCVKFVPHDSEHDYIKIFSGLGCYSNWGYRARGEQPVSLAAKGCIWKGTIMHELLHALGFDHEQNRSDRDDFLNILWDNIQPKYTSQFKKYEPWENRLITPFDYSSIMIYGEYSFSRDRNSGLKTMVPKKEGVELVQPDKKTNLSPDDIKRINILYDCPKR